MTRPIALYLHIPFCAKKCAYCDFNSYAGTADHDHRQYVAALEQEMAHWAAQLGQLPEGPWPFPVEVPSVFIGGGTPTLLSPDLLARVVRRAHELFPLTPDCEFTLEANPGTVDVAGEKLAAARAAGANRLSFGVQAFQDHLLQGLGRFHSAGEVYRSVAAARAAGFVNLNLDLMYGLPGQTPRDFTQSLEAAAALGPEHISAYSLIVEEGTPFYRQWERGRLHLPDDEAEDTMHAAALRVLTAHGYEKYEVSNFARPGYRCRHNQVYWRNWEYIGLGCGAHSCLITSVGTARRFWNIHSPQDYVQAARSGAPLEVGGEDLDEATQMAETMMLGLRLVEGVSDREFAARFHRPLAAVYGEVAARLCDRGLLECTSDHWRLTPRGMRLGNQVWAEFLP